MSGVQVLQGALIPISGVSLVVKSTSSSKPKKADPKPEERLDPSVRGSSKTAADERKGLVGFLISSRDELEKVVWPSRTQLIGESTAVLLIVVAFASFIYLIDQFFSWGAARIF